ncbi:hypothetical protein JX266_010043 [Neoarthrinium moseri]|uniref:uncharacterized protein n=1 Tax=Neoarthrinium moseri TaxID=1658444 RepID=UPI001FDDD87B|nr:uncharacterized protein JN550_004651 [Neoarthrinium moseri]KAI1843784.1 hypothetical protein JX266_010043 [Neoarthrinium moseri]KAI1871206.1 hypothetical protein JN550_004651 [Neoarthrinium moseri]
MLKNMALARVLLFVIATAVAVPTAPLGGSKIIVRDVLDSTQTIPKCAAATSSCAFAINNVAYMKYTNKPGFIDQSPDTITMAFDVTNNANGIKTACSFSNGIFMGQWTDAGTKWFPCGDRSLVDENGSKYMVKTTAQFHWDAWKMAVNQTWICSNDAADKRSNIAARADVAMAPVCKDSATESYTLKECSAPDMTTPASVV